MRAGFRFLFILFTLAFQLKAAVPAVCAEYSNGQLRLVINESNGRFSLYSLESDTPQALLADKDPRTSFLSVIINDRSYKMGDSFTFKTRLDNSGPSLVFESRFMKVTQDFYFIRNPSGANGLQIIITLENKSKRGVSAGARYLLDTSLGEGSSWVPIITDHRRISGETLITKYDNDSFWNDTDNKVYLFGSINSGSGGDPDSVHFANWKKLARVSWKAPYQSGRNFNDPPYSLRDTAVCYYFEPQNLDRGERRTFFFTLALNKDGVFAIPQTAPPVIPEIIPAYVDNQNTKESEAREQDLTTLRSLIGRIETHLSDGTGSDGELNELESAVEELRAKYGLGSR